MSIPQSIQEVTLNAAKEKIRSLFEEIREIKDFVESTFPDYVSENEDWVSDLLNDVEFEDNAQKGHTEDVLDPTDLVQPVNLVDKKRLQPMKKAAVKRVTKKRKAKRISSKGKSSGFRGVSWSSSNGKWRVRTCVYGKKFELGFYDDEAEAAQVHDEKVYKLTKDINRLNFPEDYV